MTIREKLALMKEIEERNRQHVEDWKRETESQASPRPQEKAS